MTFAFRRLERNDIPRAFRLLHAVHPCRVLSEESLRWRFDHPHPGVRDTEYVAVDTAGALVGFVRSRLIVSEDRPGNGYTTLLSVAETHRGSDLAARLLETSEKHLLGQGATSLRAEAADEGVQAGGPHFAELLRGKNYEPLESHHVLALDLSTLPDLPPTPHGVELRPFEDFSDDPRPLYEIDRTTTRDEPGGLTQDNDFPSFEEWHEHIWPHPLVALDLSLAALVNGELAGITCHHSDHGTRMESAMTGMLAPFRGHGLAAYAKTAALHRARERGITHAYTGNHSDNAPMLAINDRLGYTLAGTETVLGRGPDR